MVVSPKMRSGGGGSGESQSPPVTSPLKTEHPPLGKSNRRRSTSSIFSNLLPPLGRWTAPTVDQSKSKQGVPEDDDNPTFAREVQQDALKLNEADEAAAAEAREQEELAEILSRDDWAPSEAALFTRLRRRGREPLLPAPWRLDFATFPETLYASVGELSFICALSQNMEFRGSQALQRLVNVGGQVRDRTEINPSAPTEPLIYQEVKNFLSWAEKDGDISLSSILTINYNRDKKGSSKLASERTEKKMKLMVEELRAKLRTQTAEKHISEQTLDPEEPIPLPPTVVYGITVFNCVAAISSLNCQRESAEVKTLVVLDWTDVGLDIWNAIAIAILVVSCRNDILDSNENPKFKRVLYPDDDA